MKESNFSYLLGKLAKNHLEGEQEVTHAQVQKVAEAICYKLTLHHPLTLIFVEYALFMALLFESKQWDYGPENIAEFGAGGCLIRFSDKYKRLKKLMFNEETKAFEPKIPKNEAIVDSMYDAANYMIICAMCWFGEWPGVKAIQETGPETNEKIQ